MIGWLQRLSHHFGYHSPSYKPGPPPHYRLCWKDPTRSKEDQCCGQVQEFDPYRAEREEYEAEFVKPRLVNEYGDEIDDWDYYFDEHGQYPDYYRNPGYDPYWACQGHREGWTYHPEPIDQRVRILHNDETLTAVAMFSAERGKRSITVKFDPPVVIDDRYPTFTSDCEEFYLTDFDCARMIWGQGMEFPDPVWKLHTDDAASIVASGGG